MCIIKKWGGGHDDKIPIKVCKYKLLVGSYCHKKYIAIEIKAIQF